MRLTATLHRRWHTAKGDASVLRDHICDAARHQQDCGVVVPLAEDRDGFAAKAADFAVREDRLQAVADLGPVGAVVDGEEYQDTAIGLLGADAPFRGEVESVVDNWLAIGGGDGDYGDLRVCFLIDFGAKNGELVEGGLGQDVGEIVYVALRFVVRCGLGLCQSWTRDDQEQEREQDSAGIWSARRARTIDGGEVRGHTLYPGSLPQVGLAHLLFDGRDVKVRA